MALAVPHTDGTQQGCLAPDSGGMVVASQAAPFMAYHRFWDLQPPTRIVRTLPGSLEEREKRHSSHKEQLAREQRYLRRRLAQLRATPRDSRTISESSLPHATRADSLSSLESSSGVSTADRSPSSVSESDEVDVIGYTSNQSDSESLVSGHSADSGVGVAARRVRARSPHDSRASPAAAPQTRPRRNARQARN
ncbi:hypothetical protein NE865_13876 [Phthorimaea operculella]|nr:hypothetical protein NE865_13876 [Phthorimaea operculella]